MLECSRKNKLFGCKGFAEGFVDTKVPICWNCKERGEKFERFER